MTLEARARASVFPAALAVLLLFPAAAQAQDIQYKAAISGYPQKVDFYYFLTPECAPAGVPAVRLVQPPGQGKVVIAAGQDRPNYPRTNPRVACNAQPVSGAVVTYQSVDGYIGSDQFRLSTTFPNGEVRVREYVVDVQR